MKISELSSEDFLDQLSGQGVCLQAGPVVIKVISSIPSVAEGIRVLYADYNLASSQNFIDFHIKLASPRGIRRWYRPQVIFFLDDVIPFKPLPYSQAFPMLEWGLNWCIANHLNKYLILHSAVIERNGQAIIFPGYPGAGKSTLCAALVSNGWRLLSDEMALISLKDCMITPSPRPVSLKNESINVIKKYVPEAIIGREHKDTNKGTVAHMRAPNRSIEYSNVLAKPVFIVAPRYTENTDINLVSEPKGRMFMSLIKNSFNYHLLGESGFAAVCKLIDICDCYRFTYSNLDQAVQLFDSLIEEKA